MPLICGLPRESMNVSEPLIGSRADIRVRSCSACSRSCAARSGSRPSTSSACRLVSMIVPRTFRYRYSRLIPPKIAIRTVTIAMKPSIRPQTSSSRRTGFETTV